MKNLENAKLLCKSENTNNREGEKFNDELELQTIDLDYDTIHSEILDNIIFDENDSGLSDFDTTEEEKQNQQKKIFEITKLKTIIHNSVKSLFTGSQENNQFKPLFQQEKEVNKENITKAKENENISSNETITNEIKTQEKTENMEIVKEDIKENINEENKTDIFKEKNKEIVNYKKYNIFTDPNSNYNNFTKKYTIENNIKKRFRDIHPFLKNFNPKFLKKENIDKKIFRRFRKFVKSLYKTNKNSSIFSKNAFFWKKFYIKNLLPPVKIIDNGELIEHKSFNSQYLIWLFNQEGTIELFKLFTKEESKNLINDFIREYNLYQSKDEPDIIEKLKKYIDYIPEIYDSYNNNYDKKNILIDENKEIFDTNEFTEKKEENNSCREGDDNKTSDNNPFNLNFDLIGKKNYVENSYDDNSFYYEKTNFFDNHLRKDNDTDNELDERFKMDETYGEQLLNFYK